MVVGKGIWDGGNCYTLAECQDKALCLDGFNFAFIRAGFRMNSVVCHKSIFNKEIKVTFMVLYFENPEILRSCRTSNQLLWCVARINCCVRSGWSVSHRCYWPFSKGFCEWKVDSYGVWLTRVLAYFFLEVHSWFKSLLFFKYVYF